MAKKLTIQDIIDMPGLFLGLAALLVIIAGVGGMSPEWVLIGLLIMGGSATLSLVAIRAQVLETLFPVGSVSAVCGLILIITNVGALARGISMWPVWMLVIAGVISLLATFLAVRKRLAGGA